jgi:hypothetical protein
MNRTAVVIAGVSLAVAGLAADVVLTLANKPVPSLVVSILTAAIALLTPLTGAGDKS